MIVQKIELAPLETLHADAAYLVDRAVNGSMDAGEVVAIIRSRIEAARDDLAGQVQDEKPVAMVSQETFNHNGTSDIITPALPIGTKLYAQPPSAQAQPPVSQAERAEDWRIDNSAGRPILVYKNCSVIEAEDAHYVLRLISADRAALTQQVIPNWTGSTAADAALIMLDRLDVRGDGDDARVDEIAATIRRLAQQDSGHAQWVEPLDITDMPDAVLTDAGKQIKAAQKAIGQHDGRPEVNR